MPIDYLDPAAISKLGALLTPGAPAAFKPSDIHDPSGNADLLALLSQRRDEMEHNIGNRAGTIDNKGIHYQYATGANMEDAAGLNSDIASNPITQQRAETDTVNQANRSAIGAGIGPQGDLQPGQVAAQIAARAQSQKDNQPSLTAGVTGQYNLAAEHEKTQGASDLARQSFLRMMGLDPDTQAMKAGAGATPSANDNTTPGVPPPSEAQSSSPLGRLLSYATGSGSMPYNSLKDEMGAKLDGFLYKHQATPFSTLMQDASFGNISQMAGQIPGVRGFTQLLPLFQQHQAQVLNETPGASYARLNGMSKIMQDTIHQLDDPSVRTKMGANGQIQMAVTPAQITKAKLDLSAALARTQDAIHQSEQLYPGIGRMGAANDPAGIR